MTDRQPDYAPISAEAVPWESWGHAERFGVRFRHLTASRLGRDYHVGVAIEELGPGRQTAPFHYHMLEEEHVLVLEGELTLRLGEQRFRMKAGDYVCFPAGRKVGHCLLNEGNATCRYVIVGENKPNEVSVYPDSNKVQVRWLGERYDRSAQRDYWDGEGGSLATPPTLTPKFWDERYSAQDFLYGTEPSDFLAQRFSALPAGGEILCLAEGEGRNGVFLATKGFRVTGVDSSVVGLAKAQRLAAERGVPFAAVVADLSSWDLGDARWDGVVSIWAHLPAPVRAALHPRLARALRPGGVLLLEHYHPRQLGYGTGGPPDATMMLTLDELDAAFAGWTRLHTFEGERVVVEGGGHGGKSYVTQAILRKG